LVRLNAGKDKEYAYNNKNLNEGAGNSKKSFIEQWIKMLLSCA